MRSNAEGFICGATCWGIGLLAGVLTMVLLVGLGDWMIIQGIFVGLIVFLVAGGGLSRVFCRALPGPVSPGSHQKAAAPTAPRAPASTPAPAPAAAPAVAPAAAAPSAAPAPAPEPEAADTGVKPEGLAAPREGQPDDFKKIKGVGPKLEQQLHSLGYFHFDQIANWTPAEVAWVDENLQGFKGRVTRDHWVEQAALLAAGGETEFSKKVDKGEVY